MKLEQTTRNYDLRRKRKKVFFGFRFANCKLLKRIVKPAGREPLDLRREENRALHWALISSCKLLKLNGGADGTRTRDLRRDRADIELEKVR